MSPSAAPQNRQNKGTKKKHKVDDNMNHLLHQMSTAEQQPAGPASSGSDTFAENSAGKSVASGRSDADHPTNSDSTIGQPVGTESIDNGPTEMSLKEAPQIGETAATPSGGQPLQDSGLERGGGDAQARGKVAKYSSTRQARKKATSAQAAQQGKMWNINYRNLTELVLRKQKYTFC